MSKDKNKRAMHKEVKERKKNNRKKIHTGRVARKKKDKIEN